MIQTGQYDIYKWIVSDQAIWQLHDLVPNFHIARRLCITAFDSGVIYATDVDLALGWTMHGDIMVSPLIDRNLDIPNDEYSEWYILDQPDALQSEFEVFVNYWNFTLMSIEERNSTFDPTWERTLPGDEWLVEAQGRFWSQLLRIHPETFIASGRNTVIASSNAPFITAVADVARLSFMRV